MWRKKSNWVTAAAIIIVSAYIAWPYGTLLQFYLALKSQDRDAVAHHVNWPLLRDGLRADLDALAGDLPGAERWLERAIRDCPQFSQGWEFMLRLQTHLGNKERAAACQEKIAALAAGG